jgi:uncharacterized protein
MVDYKEKIKEFENELSTMQYNKRTQHHYGLVRAKIANLKRKDEARSSKKSQTHGYSVRRSGDATVILVGFPSSGKSTLLNATTNANSPVGDYEFTTLDVIPGTMHYKDSKVQILDVPGIVQGAASGKGRGKEVLQVMQNADLIVILVDVNRPEALKVIEKEIYDTNVRINQRKPDVKIRKTIKNGIRVGKTLRVPNLNNETIKSILKEFRINNAEVLIRTKINADQFIDIVEGNKHYIPAIKVLNKIDLVTPEKLEELKELIKPDLCISSDKQLHLDILKDLIFDRLEFMRIYCKEVSKKADLDVPLILRKGDTIKRMCEKLHKDFVKKFKFARLWGKSVKFDSQKVLKLKHKLKDKDIVELHIS